MTTYHTHTHHTHTFSADMVSSPPRACIDFGGGEGGQRPKRMGRNPSSLPCKCASQYQGKILLRIVPHGTKPEHKEPTSSSLRTLASAEEDTWRGAAGEAKGMCAKIMQRSSDSCRATCTHIEWYARGSPTNKHRYLYKTHLARAAQGR